jgi:hypothetical protein
VRAKSGPRRAQSRAQSPVEQTVDAARAQLDLGRARKHFCGPVGYFGWDIYVAALERDAKACWNPPPGAVPGE